MPQDYDIHSNIETIASILIRKLGGGGDGGSCLAGHLIPNSGPTSAEDVDPNCGRPFV